MIQKKQKHIKSYIKRIALLFLISVLPAQGITNQGDSDDIDLQNDSVSDEQVESVTKDSHLSLSVTPYGTAIKISNHIFYLDNISTEHQNLIINDFLTKGFILGVLQGLSTSGHYVPGYFKALTVLLGLFEVRNFIFDSFSNAQRDHNNGKYFYNLLFSLAYSFIDPLVSLRGWPENGISWAHGRVIFLSLSRALIEGFGLSTAEDNEFASETSTQFIPVSLYGDIARLFSIRQSYPMSPYGSPKYELVRLHLGQPAGNGSYQKLAMAMDELDIDSLSIYPSQHLHAKPSAELQPRYETDSLVMTFTLPDMDTPSTVDIPLWGASINELMVQAMHKKQDVTSLSTARSALAPDVIQVFADALVFFKHHQNQQSSTYLTYDPGMSAGSQLGTPSRVLRDNAQEALLSFDDHNNDSVSIRWKSADARNAIWPALYVDTTEYGEHSQHTQHWVPEWLGDILFMVADEAANRAGEAIGNQLGKTISRIKKPILQRTLETGLRAPAQDLVESQNEHPCFICSGEEGPSPLYQLNCRHGNHPELIHRGCFNRWINQQHTNNERYRCPLCGNDW